MQDDLTVGSRLEDRPSFLQLIPELSGIGKGPVVGQSHLARLVLDGDGLGVRDVAGALRRVAIMSDGGHAAQRRHGIGFEENREQRR